MSETVIVALIGFAGMIASSIISVIVAGNLTNYRLSRLEEEVRKHNEVVSRTYKLEEDTHIQDEQIKTLDKRLEKLESEHEKCYIRCSSQVD